MRIERVELMPCVLRKDDPKWRFALGANPTTEGVIVTLTGEGGERGYGYASATPHMGATRERLWASLERFVPLVEGHEAFVIEDTLLMLDRQMPAPNQARAAIDCALHDLPGAHAEQAAVRAVRRQGARLRADPAHPFDQDAHGDGRQGARAERCGIPLSQDQARRRCRGRCRPRARDPPRGRRRCAADGGREPVLFGRGCDRGAEPHGRVRHRSRRTADRRGRSRGIEARHRQRAGDGRGGRERIQRCARVRAGARAHRRCGQPQDPQARRADQHGRRGADLRGGRRRVPHGCGGGLAAALGPRDAPGRDAARDRLCLRARRVRPSAGRSLRRDRDRKRPFEAPRRRSVPGYRGATTKAPGAT